MNPKQGTKTIDVTAKEWFDRANGNSYFSAQVVVNFSLPDQKNIYIRYQYGYGESYIDAAKQALAGSGIMDVGSTGLWRFCRENGISLRNNKIEGCKLADVKAWGRDPEARFYVTDPNGDCISQNEWPDISQAKAELRRWIRQQKRAGGFNCIKYPPRFLPVDELSMWCTITSTQKF